VGVARSTGKGILGIHNLQRTEEEGRRQNWRKQKERGIKGPGRIGHPDNFLFSASIHSDYGPAGGGLGFTLSFVWRKIHAAARARACAAHPTNRVVTLLDFAITTDLEMA
jgi:hypothetical protein